MCVVSFLCARRDYLYIPYIHVRSYEHPPGMLPAVHSLLYRNGCEPQVIDYRSNNHSDSRHLSDFRQDDKQIMQREIHSCCLNHFSTWTIAQFPNNWLAHGRERVQPMGQTTESISLMCSTCAPFGLSDTTTTSSIPIPFATPLEGPCSECRCLPSFHRPLQYV